MEQLNGDVIHLDIIADSVDIDVIDVAATLSQEDITTVKQSKLTTDV